MAQTDTITRAEDKNRRTAMIAGFVALSMVGASFAAVPAYKAFCQVTGWGGATGRAEAPVSGVIDRRVTIRFDASTAAGLPWRFKPQQVSQTVRVGEGALAFYEAENPTDRTIVGRATYNVSPAKAGQYFKKIECFCFTEQSLPPGERVDMPVTFFIDPEIDADPALNDVETITLSYTFFPYDAGS